MGQNNSVTTVARGHIRCMPPVCHTAAEREINIYFESIPSPVYDGRSPSNPKLPRGCFLRSLRAKTRRGPARPMAAREGHPRSQAITRTALLSPSIPSKRSLRTSRSFPAEFHPCPFGPERLFLGYVRAKTFHLCPPPTNIPPSCFSSWP
jgi:hypothetical protein